TQAQYTFITNFIVTFQKLKKKQKINQLILRKNERKYEIVRNQQQKQKVKINKQINHFNQERKTKKQIQQQYKTAFLLQLIFLNKQKITIQTNKLFLQKIKCQI
ncbi:hypothetical protein TTHERM_000359159, partial (macronuclear) [Tetrahymena thermophila SB210]